MEATPAPSETRLVRLDRRDARFAFLCLLTIVVGAAIVRAGFSRAFPEASIDFRVTRGAALKIAEKAVAERGFDLSGFTPLVVFDHDDEAKVFLERTLGLARANPIFETTVPIWRWSVRWVKPLEKLEYRANVSPQGQLLAFRRLLSEKAPAKDPGAEEARRLAADTLRKTRGLDPDSLRFVEGTEERRPNRLDRTFVWESRTIRFGDGALRYLVEVQGDRVGRSTLYLYVPESWKKEYETLRSKNEATGAAAGLGLFLTGVALLGTFLARVRRRDVRWRWAFSFAAVGTALQLLASLNELPVKLFDYPTAESWAGFVTKAVLGSAGGALLLGVVLLLLVAGGEPVYREAYPDKPALGLILSRRGFRSRRFFRGLLLGYALTAFFFAYQVAFYLMADRLGAWAPAEVPYSNLLGTWFPWLAVLLMGFVPATTEEFSSRMFSIPFAQRFLPRWAAVALPAAIWGFAHSAYPNQPFFIRGLEVGIAGVVIGVVLLKADIFPLLVWHFTVDAVYTSLLLVRSSNPYFVVSGLFSALLLLLPLAVSLVLYVRRGGFLPDEGFSNAAAGTAPAAEVIEPAEPAAPAPARPMNGRWLIGLAGLALALLFLSRVFLPRVVPEKEAPLRLSREEARAAAARFVTSQGDSAAAYLSVPEVDSALPALEEASDTGADLIPYEWAPDAERWLLAKGGLPGLLAFTGRTIPGPVWQVRLFRPLDRHGYWVVVDGHRGEVIGFKRTFPKEEPGAALGTEAALDVARRLLSTVRLDPASSRVVSSREETQKARRDHRFLFETDQGAVGEARQRAVIELAGDKPALVATALKLPEEWARSLERWPATTYAAVAWKVAGIGVLAGLALFELIRCARQNVPWRRLAQIALLLTLPALVRLAAALPQLLRRYPDPPDLALSVFAVSASAGVLVSLVMSFGMALVVLVLVQAVRPDFRLAFSSANAPALRTLLAAAAGAAIVVSARSFEANLAAAWPVAIGFGGFQIPPGVESLLPAADVLQAAVRNALLLAGGAALGVLLSRDLLAWVPARVGVLLSLAGLFAPLGARTAAELLVPVVARSLVGAAWLAAAACLLRDDLRAYLVLSVLLFVGEGALELLRTPVPWWQANGAAAAAVGVGVLVWLLYGRARTAPAAI